uniref:Ycf1 protein n=1 Tax=Pleurospermum longicarpum TaxID=1729592 RepID=UPI0023AA9593|nr:Ycf1 protein [Pleurospermum longicarpum]WCF69414.1 Ycf1 protein [Pleurospermum longicarpum]
MILKSFLLGNLVSLCMKIINSVVVVGLYYGFLTTFSIGPSYLFLLRAQVMEEGTEKKVSATTGFITGQLMMFISIYYAPLHLALGRPHTITVLALPYLLFHFFWNNHKNFFDYGSTTRNSMRNLSIQCVFLNNLIFQLFNHFILPSSMLARLVNIYMFRCNNKMLFVTSSFVGWLIGHILFMKWVGLVLVWIRQNNSIRSNVLIRSNKSELRNSMARIFSILLFITCVYYLGRIPSPIFTKKLNPQTEEGWESEEETDVEIETASETKGTKQEQEGSTEEDPSPSLFSEEKEDPDKIDETEEIRVNGKEKTKDEFHFTETRYNNSPVYKGLFWFEKPLLTFLFDYKRWNRPLRYIKNNRFERTARKEMSQYFFYTCRSDGKERISFTYPPSLSTFGEMIQRRMSLPTLEKLSSDELYNHWVYTNQHKNNNLNNEFLNRIEALDTGFFSLDILEKSTRLCNDKTRKDYLPKMYDPILNGLYRGTIKNKISPSIINKILLENFIETMEINKIHSILLPDTDYQEFEQKIDRFDKKTFSTENRHLFTLISKFDRESGSSLNWKGLSLFSEKEQGRIGSEKRAKFYKFLLNTILTSPNGQKTKQKFVIKEISKKVPRWSYKLITELEFLSGAAHEGLPLDYQIRSRKRDRVIIYRPTKRSRKASVKNWVSIRDYSEESDFRREFIKGSMRAQRRKTAISKLFQANVHSPLFLDRIKKSPLFSFNIAEQMKFIFINWMGKGTEFKDYTEEQKKKQKEEEENKKKEKPWIKIAEAWDFVPYPQATRSLILIIQSIFRKYILLPSLIIVKNIGRILLSQPPEWAEDFDEWNREKHIICTYNGVQLSELQLPRNWFKDGIQIKIVFPFYLKPWHRSKLRPSFFSYKDLKKEQRKFFFLTAWGTQTNLPFGSVSPKPSFFKPILKELKKKIRKTKNNHFQVLRVLKERTKRFLQDSKEPKREVIKNVLFMFIKRIKKELLKVHPTRLFILRKVYESGETNQKKDYIIRNQIIHDSFRKIKSTDNTNYSLREKKIKNLADRTNIITKKTKSLTKEKNSNAKKKSSSNKTIYNVKVKSSKNSWQILKIKRRSTRLIYKLYFFIKIFIKRIYIDIFLCIIHIARITTQLVLESKNFCFDKYIYNNKTNQEIKNKKNKKEINFISTLKSALYNIKNSKKSSHLFFNLSSLSQAYVFYKLSQTRVINFYKLRSILDYHGTPFFLKTAIKNSFVTQGIFHSELRHTKLTSSEMNQWKNWLRSHYQYNLSQIRWSGLIPQKWRTTITEGGMTQNKDLTKWNSNEKDRLLYHKKQKDFKVYPLPNQKDNLPKYYIYDLLSYKSINSEMKKSSYIIYGSPSELNNNQKITFNYNNYKQNFFESLEEIPINNYLEKGDIMYMQKNPDRKYFDWTILNFFLRQKIDIEAWTKMDYNSNINTKIGSKNYQKIDKMDKNNLFYLTIHQNLERNPINDKKLFFDWMEMNEEILNPISTNLKLLFFPEFVPLYNVYKIKPWIIPSKLLLFNKNINEKQKWKFFRLSNEKRYYELMNRNQEEKEPADRRGLRSYAQNQGKMKKQYKIQNKMRPEMIFLRKHYLLFQWIIDDGLIPNLTERMINNIKIYCYLLGLRNPRDTTISSIQRKEINLDIMVIRKKLTPIELNKKGIFFIEPVRLSVKNDGYFIMYQTVGISLVHKSKYQTPQRCREQRCREQRYIDKNKLDESIPRYQRLIRKRDKKHYDFIVPEKIFSSRRRRELRILISFNSKNINSVDRNRVFCNKKNIKSGNPFLDQSKHLDRDKNELIKLKLFLWPNYRLEDLACMNRYWFNTNNGSRFSMLRIYPQLKIG